MSVSTRTAQQPLGYGPLGAALVVVTMAIILAAAFAFGQFGAADANVNAGPAGVPVPGHLSDPKSYELSIPGSGGTINVGNNGPRLRPQ